jgi:trimeric autotransporter adhesin
VKKIALILLILCCQFCRAQNWQPLGSGLNWYAEIMYEDTVLDQLFIGGAFTSGNSLTMRHITAYDGVFNPLQQGLNQCPFGSGQGRPFAIVRYNGWIYVAGNFSCVSGVSNTKALARWNGTVWDSVGSGVNGTVYDLQVYNNELYACGVFDSAGGIAANRIAKWNGTSWSTVPNSYIFGNGWLTRMQFYHGKLYVAGNFSDSNSFPCSFACWDGNTWQISPTIGNSGLEIWDMEIYNDELIVAGGFYYGNGNPSACIIRWNDTTWRDVGGGVQMGVWNSDPVVKNLCVHNGMLYCIGNFEKIGGITAMGLASWDGNQWCGYDTYFDFAIPNNYVGATTIAFYHDTMYVAGGFDMMNTDTMRYIAKWVGGSFVDVCGTAVGIHDTENSRSSVGVYPNPASDIIMFAFSGDQQPRELVIYDALGKEVWREETNQPFLSVSVQAFSDGIYFYSINAENGELAQGKFLVQ